MLFHSTVEDMRIYESETLQGTKQLVILGFSGYADRYLFTINSRLDKYSMGL
jgi:hypothetical protein